MKTFFYRLILRFSTIDLLNWFRQNAREKRREARRGAGYAHYTMAFFDFDSFLIPNKTQKLS